MRLGGDEGDPDCRTISRRGQGRVPYALRSSVGAAHRTPWRDRWEGQRPMGKASRAKRPGGGPAAGATGGAVTLLVCGFRDIPQVRSYAAVMGGIALGMAAGPLIARSPVVAKPAA